MREVPNKRLEIGIGGTLEGRRPGTTAVGNGGTFTDVPDLVLAQRGEFGPIVYGIGSYSGSASPSGMTLLIPESPAGWNGKLFVLAHGSSQYPEVGELVPRKPEEYNRSMGRNSYAGLMIDKGYAVAYTRRAGAKFGSANRGGESVTFYDGTKVGGELLHYHTGLLKDFTELAKNIVQNRLANGPFERIGTGTRLARRWRIC